MIPPSDKEVGDAGHTDDHNAITTVMVDHQERLAIVEAGATSVVFNDEPNDISVNNTTNAYHTQIEIPSGDRSGQPDVWSIVRSAERIFGFNGNGYPRSRSNSATDIHYVAQAHPTQTADLAQWVSATGTVLARVDAQGRFQGGNVTPGAWTNIILSGTYQWDSTAGNRPQWRQVGDKIEVRGALRRQDSDPIVFTGSPLLIGSMPPSSGAPGGARAIQPTQQTSNGIYCQAIISPDGTIRITGDGSHSPLWVSLDGISFSLTAS